MYKLTDCVNMASQAELHSTELIRLIQGQTSVCMLIGGLMSLL